MSELAFFIGKGGVGKTTISAAYALRSARLRLARPVLLISIDPAHSLGDILRLKLGESPKVVLLGGSAPLAVWEMNAAKIFRTFLETNKQGLVENIARGSLFNKEDVAALLDTTLPGMSEMGALLAIYDQVRRDKYSQIVVDTAPLGHTLRLFTMPKQFLRLLNVLELSSERDRVLARHFGGAVANKAPDFVDEWRTRIDGLQQALASANLYLVTTTERFALNESSRCMAELASSNPELKLKAVVLNRVVKRHEHCVCCRSRAEAARVAASALKKMFPKTQLLVGRDPGFPILGVQGLTHFAVGVFATKTSGVQKGLPAPKTSESPSERSRIALTRTSWPELSAPLVFVLGKGGVGKTTISAGLAYNSRQHSSAAVEICSVDPAPSLDDIFQAPVGDQRRTVLGDRSFRASELDSIALFKRWVAEIRAELESATSYEHSGIHVDLTFERRMFSELLDIVPPGLDEILAVFRIIELGGREPWRVLIDMAPTAHALELLRTPERILAWSRLLLKSLAVHRKLAVAREAAAKIAELEVRARELSRALRNSKEAAIYVVMLAEPLPDRETERLIRQLRELELSPRAIFVNRVLFPQCAATCGHCHREAQLQARVLAQVRKRFSRTPIYVIRDFGREVAGKSGLHKLTRELWRLQ